MAREERQEVILGGKVVGWIAGDTYVTHRVAKKHFYIKGRGYPISDKILRVLGGMGVVNIVVEEERAGGELRYWGASVKQYLDAPALQEEGYDLQRCLPLASMVVR